MELLAEPQFWIGFLTLTLLEVVLGIDNIVFISILAGKLPADQQARARQTGLMLAMATRILFVFTIGLIMRLTSPIFTIPGVGEAGAISVKDLILILGGLFLIAKATHEIHSKLEGDEGHVSAKVAPTFAAVIGQILAVDLVFSIDSVITAVGMVPYIEAMVLAIVVSVIFMLVAAGAVSAFIERHPTVKMLALSFLVLIGVNLIADGFDVHIPKGYTYFAMAFSIIVEMINIRLRSRGGKDAAPVHLRQAVAPKPAGHAESR